MDVSIPKDDFAGQLLLTSFEQLYGSNQVQTCLLDNENRHDLSIIQKLAEEQSTVSLSRTKRDSKASNFTSNSYFLQGFLYDCRLRIQSFYHLSIFGLYKVFADDFGLGFKQCQQQQQ